MQSSLYDDPYLQMGVMLTWPKTVTISDEVLCSHLNHDLTQMCTWPIHPQIPSPSPSLSRPHCSGNLSLTQTQPLAMGLCDHWTPSLPLPFNGCDLFQNSPMFNVRESSSRHLALIPRLWYLQDFSHLIHHSTGSLKSLQSQSKFLLLLWCWDLLLYPVSLFLCDPPGSTVFSALALKPLFLDMISKVL